MRQRVYSKKEFHKLLHSYFTCLDMYFSVLVEAHEHTKLSQKKKDTTSIEVLERFIETGKKIQHILQYLQNKELYP